MPLTVNLRHLENEDVRLEGELPVKELDLDARDEMVRVEEPLQYDLEARKLDDSLLVQGRLHLNLRCQCVRCLKPFSQAIDLPEWTYHAPLQGEDAAPISGDFADLTPRVREDILLEFPQHPLCGANCPGLPKNTGKTKKSGSAGQSKAESSAWTELDKLKF